MPSARYLDLDAKKLFEEHGVREIERIRRAIQLESDRKKIELRTLVGERYRDLIRAADTIAEMRRTSADVFKRIAEIEATFRRLGQKYSSGFQISSPDVINNGNAEEALDSAAVMLIKILIDIPEHIWSAIDDGDPMLASQLFILARHVDYSLTFEVGRSILADRYPIAAKQWSIIANFKNVIINECDNSLRSPELTTEVAANCLAALVLLEGASSKDLLEKLIDSRSRAIESILKDESPRGVRHRLVSSIESLTNTVVLVHSCFTKTRNGRNVGAVAERVNELREMRASELLRARLDLEPDSLERCLSSRALRHPLFQEGIEDPTRDADNSAILGNWLNRVENLTSTEVTRLLGLVTSVRGVCNIREECSRLDLPEDWEKMTGDSSLPPGMDFWSMRYRPLVTQRVREIIEEKWRDASSRLRTSLAETLAKISEEKRSDLSEEDLRRYVWRDSSADLPDKLFQLEREKCDSTSVGAATSSLLIRSRGFSPNLVELLRNLNEDLSRMLRDLEEYLYGSEKSPKDRSSSGSGSRPVPKGAPSSILTEKFADRGEIQETLQRSSERAIDELLERVRSDFAQPRTSHGRYETNLMFLARFCQAIAADLCPSLGGCFALSRTSAAGGGAGNAANAKWRAVRDRARDVGAELWSVWANDFHAKRVREYRERFLVDATNGNVARAFASGIGDYVSEWEKASIVEEAEEGESIVSEIRVPYRASLGLQKFLAAVSHDLNKVVPHTVPKKVVREMIERAADELLDHYCRAANGPDVPQNRAFQMLFDVKFATLLLVPRENDRLTDRSRTLTEIVLAKIDPFDSDVYRPFIRANVNKCVRRSLLIFGNLVPRIEQLRSVLGSRGDSASSDGAKSTSDPPGGPAVLTGAPWFPPLAVAAPARNSAPTRVSAPERAQPEGTPATKEGTKNEFAGANIKSGAAAFFGAMSSDWFGAS